MKKTQSGGRWKHLCEVTPEFTLLFFFQMIETILDYMALPSCFKYRQTLSLEKKKILAQIILLTVCFGSTYSTGTWASQVALVVKNSPASARHKRCGFDPWVRKIPWRRACNPLQYFRLENPMDRGAWWATVHRVTKSWIQLKRLSVHAYTHTHTHTHTLIGSQRVGYS